MPRWLRRSLRTSVVFLTLVVASSFVTSGCFGKFNVTRNIYKFNQRVSPDKWARWGVFLAFNVVPVYGVSAIMDSLIFNSVEFWTGKNPAKDVIRPLRSMAGPPAYATVRSDGRLEIAIQDEQGQTRHLELVRELDSLAAYDAQGRLIARVGDRDGQPALLEAGPGLAGSRF